LRIGLNTHEGCDLREATTYDCARLYLEFYQLMPAMLKDWGVLLDAQAVDDE
jgi:hypothetical protein